LSDHDLFPALPDTGPPSTAGFVFLDGLFLRGRRAPANLPVGRDLTIRRKIENGRYYYAFCRSNRTTSRSTRAVLKPPPRRRCTKPFMRIPIGRRCVSMSVGYQCRIRTEEKIAGCQPPPVSDPALRQMVRPIVQHVAALTERAQILHPIVGRVAIQVRRCEHDARHPRPSRLHKIRPSGRAPSAVPPDRCFSSNQRPSGTQRRKARCGRPQRWHFPPARSKRTWLLSSRQRGG
jgi:hypothetical protein